jgi:hypothetical protein
MKMLLLQMDRSGVQWIRLVHGGFLVGSFPSVPIQSYFHKKCITFHLGGVGPFLMELWWNVRWIGDRFCSNDHDYLLKSKIIFLVVLPNIPHKKN